MERFRAIWITRDETTKRQNPTEIREIGIEDLSEGDVTVRVETSTVNYKDGLAITGKGPVVRRFPMVPGVDLAGTVVASTHAGFREGDAVLLNGWGVGETHTGAFAGYARLKGEWLIRRPAALSARDAMAIGTAGYTAMLAVLVLEAHGLTPERGPVVVTGAAGGVGSVAIALLAKRGFGVVAVTGRTAEADYLRGLGAREIVDRAELSEPGRPLAKERWAGGIDVVGGPILANVLAATVYRGAVAACGLAASAELPTTVMPFILRGVSLLGIDSVMAPIAQREAAYARLVTDLDRGKLAAMTEVIGFDGIIPRAEAILRGEVRGRTVVDIAG